MLKDKIVIVTGGCSGIGWGITQAAVTAGATVIACQRSLSGAERIARLVKIGFNAEFMQVDISQPDEIQEFIQNVIDKYGRIDVLINNAGITIEGDFFDFPLEKLDLLWATNQRSTFLLSQAAAKHMRKARKGNILNISSNHSHASVAGYEMYAATKGAISAMTRAMSWSLGAHGIRVNTLSPGLTLTEAVQDVVTNKPSLDAAFRDLHATKEVSSVEDIANIAVFLVSDLAKAITGEEILADQGVAAQLCRTDQLK